MIARFITPSILENLEYFPVAGIIGPRQVGKTTLAKSLRSQLPLQSLYLDLELDSDVRKLEDAETGQVELTCVACRLLDDSTCHCTQYDIRHQFVPECIVMSPSNIDDHAYWMPQTCAYRLLWEGKPLFNWHPLISGDPNSVHQAGVSIQHRTVSEFEVDEDDWEDYIIEEPA